MRLLNNKIVDYWNVPIRGSLSFAVWKDYVLFDDGYNHHDVFSLMKLESNHQMTLLAKVQFTTEEGIPMLGFRRNARGNVMFLMRDNQYYKIILPDLIERLNLSR